MCESSSCGTPDRSKMSLASWASKAVLPSPKSSWKIASYAANCSGERAQADASASATASALGGLAPSMPKLCRGAPASAQASPAAPAAAAEAAARAPLLGVVATAQAGTTNPHQQPTPIPTWESAMASMLSSGGKAFGSSVPCLRIATRCMAQANSPKVSKPSPSTSASRQMCASSVVGSPDLSRRSFAAPTSMAGCSEAEVAGEAATCSSKIWRYACNSSALGTQGRCCGWPGASWAGAGDSGAGSLVSAAAATQAKEGSAGSAGSASNSGGNA
mmetsp:Transcript_30366/g.100788  ORF Transcript_30366/g.100788 Transcript_30366/m.100788 type:complete len:275 (+) Transcript_30366:1252-2076(+)